MNPQDAHVALDDLEIWVHDNKGFYGDAVNYWTDFIDELRNTVEVIARDRRISQQESQIDAEQEAAMFASSQHI